MDKEDKSKINRAASNEKIAITYFVNFINQILLNIKFKAREHEWYDFLKNFLSQIMLYLDTNMIHINSLVNEQTLARSNILPMDAEYDGWVYFESCILNMLSRFFCMQIHAVVEESIKSYLNHKKIDFFEKTQKDKKEILTLECYVNKICQHIRLTSKERKAWIHYFNGLTVLRNRGAHSNRELTTSDIEKLELTGLDGLKNNKNKIAMNISDYRSVLEKIIEFYEQVFL